MFCLLCIHAALHCLKCLLFNSSLDSTRSRRSATSPRRPSIPKLHHGVSSITPPFILSLAPSRRRNRSRPACSRFTRTPGPNPARHYLLRQRKTINVTEPNSTLRMELADFSIRTTWPWSWVYAPPHSSAGRQYATPILPRSRSNEAILDREVFAVQRESFANGA